MKLDLKNTFFLLDMFLIVGGEGSSNRNASRDESVEAGDKSVEAGDESIEAGENHHNHVIVDYSFPIFCTSCTMAS